MEKLIRFTLNDLTKITNHRSGEIKFGERIQTVPKEMDTLEFVQSSDAEFVLLGIPEDIGVRANLGRPGTASAWESTLKSIVNIQNNRFCKGSQLLILGKIDVSAEMEEVTKLDIHSKEDRKNFFKLVEKIDKEVSHIVCQIIKAGKTPIVIGGGHNNAYGNIKGLALAKGKPVNAINFDAHTDFRALEGRHSGNGFSYAFEEGFLKKYFIFGLHESYTPKSVLDAIKKVTEKIKYNTYEQIAVRKEKGFEAEMEMAKKHIASEPFGIEIDLDAIPGIASSAMTLSGFSAEQLRQFIHYFGQSLNASYLHICEGAPDLDNEKNNHLVGKLIAYLVTDFMKAKLNI
ncbi:MULTISPECIES: formimidoylglutamase [Flavobacterium]|uniref:formimidoylglutamase n=1 Tax=Flavobacterium TaxID=237 RepID=UPI00095EA3AC|nr:MULTISPECIES: formimidoylglutamase [Flavobacterium]MBN9285742.1 formimidoylglutamase [Flavobacterium sp.]OJV70375.1 MAG: arginase [Flavobacterium sp. 40-81]